MSAFSRTTVLASISMAAISTSATAQQAEPPAQAAATTQSSGAPEPINEAGSLAEIVVTARRVSERVQDTPVAVTALSADQLENANITGTEGLSALAPSLQIAAAAPNLGVNSAATVFIRGIGQLDPTPAADPGVGIYIDDVYMGSAVGGIMDFRDIANVQILRGPQGTLFGRNTIGGAILLTSTKPGDVAAADVRLGVGSDNLRDIRTAVDLPISDTLRTRFTYGARTRDGYVTRVRDGEELGDITSQTVTGKIAWDITPSLHALLKLDYTDERSNGTPFVLARVRNSAPLVIKPSIEAGCPGVSGPSTPVPEVNDPRCFNNFFVLGPHRTASTDSIGSTLENWGAQANFEYSASDALTFKSITSYRHLKYTGSRDSDNSPFLDNHSDAAGEGPQTSQELQAIVNTERVTWVSGLYYFHLETDFKFIGTLNNFLLPSPAPANTPAPPTGVIYNVSGIYDSDAYAAFSQASYKFTDALQLTLGARYSSETKRFLPNQHLFGYANQPYLPRVESSRSSHATTGTAALQYRWSEQVMTYASWTRGYKGGGWTRSYTNFLPGPTGFAPEYAEAAEIGAKLDLSRNVRLNLAAFNTDYEDMQLLYRVGVNPTTVNAGKAVISGAEAEIAWAATSSLLFTGNASYLHHRIESVATIPDAVTAVTTANKLPFVPEVQGQLAAEYTFSLSGALEGSLRAAVTYTGKQFFEIGNDRNVAQLQDEATGEIGMGISNLDRDWSLRLSVMNITDNVYPITGNSVLAAAPGYDEIAYNRGREWMVTLSKGF
jgi:iron complex outermembrane receptor protein